jgi:hypothetical protein
VPACFQLEIDCFWRCPFFVSFFLIASSKQQVSPRYRTPSGQAAFGSCKASQVQWVSVMNVGRYVAMTKTVTQKDHIPFLDSIIFADRADALMALM